MDKVRTIVSLLLLVATLSVHAQERRVMNIHKNGTVVATYNVADIDSVTFTTVSDSTGDDVIDLGTPANTYIVPAAGRYRFETTRVSGLSIDGIDHVDWLWATKGNDGDTQDYVSDITYADDYVTFTASGKKGDVVLGAYDAQGRIIWTWLLWLTDTPSQMQYANGVTFMDRNIGATSATPADHAATWGLVWQWGRPTPFFAGYDTEWEAKDAFTQSRQWTIVNPNLKMAWNFTKEGATMEEAIANPLTFYDNDSLSNWHVTTDTTLWGRVKTDYDPSPAGWRLPMPDEMAVLKDLVYDDANVGYTYSYNGQSAWWPASGSGREYDTGCNLIGSKCTYIWTASAEHVNDIFLGGEVDAFWRFIAEGGNTVWAKAMGNPAFAHSLRCVKDE